MHLDPLLTLSLALHLYLWPITAVASAMASNSTLHTGALLLGLPFVTTMSAYDYRLQDGSSPSAKPRLAPHAAAASLLYLTALTCLSLAAAEHWHITRGQTKKENKDKRQHDHLIHPWLPLRPSWSLAARATGLVAGAYVLVLPLLAPPADPVLHGLLRVATFFAACKAWDLTLARADRPPVPLGARDAVRYGLVGWRAHARYVWLVLSEMRYASFEPMTLRQPKPKPTPGPTPAPSSSSSSETAAVASNKPTPPPPPPSSSSRASTFALVLAIPLALAWPAAEVQAVAGLCTIAAGLEACHALLHVGCRRPLFHRPLAATSPAAFWARHWHQAAQSFLLSLGYAPARRACGRAFGSDAVGRAAGVLGAFALSGLWHAWASFVFTAPGPASWRQAVGMWAIFVLQGALVLFERGVLRDDKWRRGWRQKLVVAAFWAVSIESISVWIRYAVPRAIVQVRLPW